MHRWVRLAHLLQRFLGGDPAVHHPDPSGLAVLAFDAIKKPAQRGLVRGVARQHLVGQRQTLGRDHQRDDHLHTVGPLVARIPEAAFVLVAKRRIGLKVRAGQVVEQHVELDVEQIPPTPDQVIEQRRLVFEQLVVTGVELVALGQARVGTQQIGQGALLKPVPMQPPFAARREQPVGDQHEQDLLPTCPFAALRQTFRPEPIQCQLLPKFQRQPAGAPHARAAQAQLRQT